MNFLHPVCGAGRDLEQRLAEPEPRADRQHVLGEVEVDLKVVAGQIERTADQLRDADVHQRDLRVEVALPGRPTVAGEAVLDRHLGALGRLVDALVDANADPPDSATRARRGLGHGPRGLQLRDGRPARSARAITILQ